MSNRRKLEYGVATGMRPVAGAWQRMADVVLGSLNISNSQGWALVQLTRLGDAVRQRDLARAVGIAEASLVRTLHQLERAEYVVRTPDPDDKRSNLLTLTPAGTRIAQGIDARLIALRQDLLDGLSDADLGATLRVLDHVAARIADRHGRP